MSLLWFVALAALAASLMAWRQARAAARRVAQLSQMYWELKYQHGELRAQLQRQTSSDPSIAAAPPERGPAAAPTAESGVSGGFIPLSSLKR